MDVAAGSVLGDADRVATPVGGVDPADATWTIERSRKVAVAAVTCEMTDVLDRRVIQRDGAGSAAGAAGTWRRAS